MERIVAYHVRPLTADDPFGYDAPPELVLAWHIGEARLLRYGGLMDQPAMYFKVARAAYLWDVLREISKDGFKVSDLKDDVAKFETALELQRLRQQLQAKA